MEVMDAPLDKFYKKIYENKDRIPEDVLSIVAFSVSVLLHSFHYCVQTTYKKASNVARIQGSVFLSHLALVMFYVNA